MVCLGNICRSPLAEGIMREKIRQNGLPWEVDSAGTSAWHAGDAPDHRSVLIARDNHIDISRQCARPFVVADFDRFDHILVMDSSNYTEVSWQARHETDRQKISLIMEYARPGRNESVPDPYYGGADGFSNVFHMLDQACEAFIRLHTP